MGAGAVASVNVGIGSGGGVGSGTDVGGADTVIDRVGMGAVARF
jgi:hypothetical protein